MTTHEFTVIATCADLSDPNLADRLFEAGCDDATMSIERGVAVLAFSREGKSFPRALVSAIRDLESAGARVLRLEPDPLVSLSEIAARAGVTRASISLYARGERGKEFPLPVHRITSESPLWDWVDVARWFCGRGALSREEVARATALRRINRAIDRRRAVVRPILAFLGATPRERSTPRARSAYPA